MDKKVHLIHGDSDYLIFKEYKALKKRLEINSMNLAEFTGAKSLPFDSLYNALMSSDLFASESIVIIREVMDGKSFFPFVEGLVDFLNTKNENFNTLYIFHYGKVLKTSKIYKSISKLGNVNEVIQPKEEELLQNIKKSINITDTAAKLLIGYTNGNMFQIGNEVQKLRSYLTATNKEKIGESDIETLCVKRLADSMVWNIGSEFLNYKLEGSNLQSKAALLKHIDNLLINNVAPMQILYSFYQNILNALKMKRMILQGKNFRECMALGYFFVKEFFEKRDKMKVEELIALNSKLLNTEFQIKTGQMDEIFAIKKLILNY
jgi:DNA polymerase-3 subunit delta